MSDLVLRMALIAAAVTGTGGRCGRTRGRLPGLARGLPGRAEGVVKASTRGCPQWR